MNIAWLPLLGGLFFGLIPPKLLLNSECRYLRFEAMWERVANRKKSIQKRRRWWKLPLVWIDPVRGYMVATLVHEGLKPLGGGLLGVSVNFLVLLVILFVQTSGRSEQGETLSPAGFLGGMMLALLPPIVSISAIVLGVSTAVAMSRFVPGYVIASLVTASVGIVFMGKNLWLVSYTVLIAFPMILSWLKRSSLVVPVRS